MTTNNDTEWNLRRALQEIATGEITNEPNNKADTLAICKAIAVKALEDNPPADEPRYSRND